MFVALVDVRKLRLRNPQLNKPANVTNKPKKKDSDMKIDKTTYKDKENQIGLTDYRTSRPEKVLFFAAPHLAHCLLPDTQANASQKSKSQIFLTHTLKVNIV